MRSVAPENGEHFSSPLLFIGKSEMGNLLFFFFFPNSPTAKEKGCCEKEKEGGRKDVRYGFPQRSVRVPIV